MNINHSEYTIAEIIDGLANKTIRINTSYQRSAGIWPSSAQTYFIDTILEHYPFPKLYFHQTYDRDRKKPIQEVVDGQQRLQAINDFIQDKLRLGKNSHKYSQKIFSELDDDIQVDFRMYRVPVDVILAADRSHLLEMFRRMNAYTAPLNPAEKRHAKWQGRFKWFAVELADRISPVLEEFGILTAKQIIRMSDVELIADFVLVLERGLINRSENSIEDLYKKYDSEFQKEELYFNSILNFFNILVTDFNELRNTFLMKTYALHSFFAAYAHITVGIPQGAQDIGFESPGSEIRSDKKAVRELLELGEAHETKDTDGKYKDYVKAALSTTTKAAQRRIRTRFFANILRPL